MRKFISKCLVFLCLLSLVFLPAGVGLDPYNVFHWNCIVSNGVEPNKVYVKMKNVLTHPDKFDSFLFGSSRAGFFDVTRMDDGRYYDMSYSEGTVNEHLQNLKDFIDRGIVPKNVTVALDDITYFVDPASHVNQLYRKPFPWDGTLMDKIKFYLSYLDLITISQSIEVIQKHMAKDSRDLEYGARILETGSENLTIKTQFDYGNLKPSWSDYYRPREECFEEIREFKELCEEHDIKLRIFTNPINGYTYKKDIANGYLVFLRKLSDITEYWNFSGFNDITLNMDNYYETSHFNPEVSNMVVDTVYHGKTDERLLSQGFGVYVTKDNVDELLDILYGQAVNYDFPTDTYQDIPGYEPDDADK
ncbi:MAG: hypothetical protein J6P05_04695 [Lachnospiraceae bacterium]|nr:hypothetical protein [Lachnospiraceae bacterium]